MYCDHLTCKKEVDINSVVGSQSKSALTKFNEDGFGVTRASEDINSILKVCKSCGKSEYLWENFDAMVRTVKERETRKSKRDKRIITVIVCLVFFIAVGILITALIKKSEQRKRLKLNSNITIAYPIEKDKTSLIRTTKNHTINITDIAGLTILIHDDSNDVRALFQFKTLVSDCFKLRPATGVNEPYRTGKVLPFNF